MVPKVGREYISEYVQLVNNVPYRDPLKIYIKPD